MTFEIRCAQRLRPPRPPHGFGVERHALITYEIRLTGRGGFPESWCVKLWSWEGGQLETTQPTG